MALSSLGYDNEKGVNLFQCDECGELYGKLPGSVELVNCARCVERRRVETFKKRIYEAQRASLLLAAAIQKHQEATMNSEFELTDADAKLYATLDEVEIKNDAPTGIVAIINE